MIELSIFMGGVTFGLLIMRVLMLDDMERRR